jgi:hypothetical protein
MIKFRHIGNFNNTEKFFNKVLKSNPRAILESHAREGVAALSAATPKDTGLTADSWNYEIKVSGRGYDIIWTNSNVPVGSNVPLVVLIQYGHGTPSGVYVEGRNFINPALKPIVEVIVSDLWKEVSNR